MVCLSCGPELFSEMIHFNNLQHLFTIFFLLVTKFGFVPDTTLEYKYFLISKVVVSCLDFHFVREESFQSIVCFIVSLAFSFQECLMTKYSLSHCFLGIVQAVHVSSYNGLCCGFPNILSKDYPQNILVPYSFVFFLLQNLSFGFV